jgi:hypothetical protein
MSGGEKLWVACEFKQVCPRIRKPLETARSIVMVVFGGAH